MLWIKNNLIFNTTTQNYSTRLKVILIKFSSNCHRTIIDFAKFHKTFNHKMPTQQKINQSHKSFGTWKIIRASIKFLINLEACTFVGNVRNVSNQKHLVQALSTLNRHFTSTQTNSSSNSVFTIFRCQNDFPRIKLVDASEIWLRPSPYFYLPKVYLKFDA